jgi:HEAT repeat protein
VKKASLLERQLAALEAAPHEALRAALREGPALLAARAAQIVRERAIDCTTPGLADDLVAAFRRFAAERDPVKKDPGCRAKLAALEALDYGCHDDAAPFLEATRLIQQEPAWGPPVDTATGVRARGVLALARLGHADLPLVAGALLADPESPARQAAAEALAASRDRSAAGLLLLRWRLSDEDPQVVLACMAGTLALAPDQALPRLGQTLAGADAAARELAALALGQSGRDDALDLLLADLESPPLSERAGTLRALGLHRSERALAALLEVIATGPLSVARTALAALAPRRFDAKVRERAQEAAARSDDAVNLARELAALLD